MNEEEEYRKRKAEVDKRLSDPEISGKIDKYLAKIAKLANCDAELNFVITPYLDDYMEKQDNGEIELSNLPTMKLSEFVTHLKKEKTDFDVYIDPIYLKKGVNEIVDVLITTLERKMIIVPISSKKSTKL